MDQKVAKIGINGFGRMGKLIFRSTFMDQKNKAQVVAINAPNIGLKYLKYLLEYDSVHGRFPGTIEVDHEARGLVVDGEFVRVFHTRNPTKLNWGEVGVDYVIDRNSNYSSPFVKAQDNFRSGAKKTVFAAPTKYPYETPTFVFGVNEEEYRPNMNYVSSASNATNCLAPLAKLINDKFGIEEGFLTIVSDTTASN